MARRYGRVPYHVKTSDGVTHSAWAAVTGESNDARTACGIHVHHCDFQHCRHYNRHRGRTFSRTTSTEVDCMACVTSPNLGEE